MILAIDPGTSKIGWALVDNLGKAAGQGITPIGQWDDQLRQLADPGGITVVVIGNGTNRMNIASGVQRQLQQARVVSVDETGSTVEAWKLKRGEEAGRNPWRVLLFTLRQLFGQEPVDDYAARVLAQRYLARQNASPAGPRK
jgi:RNase H-fold protein (predicted Holliday junction resolvase)